MSWKIDDWTSSFSNFVRKQGYPDASGYEYLQHQNTHGILKLYYFFELFFYIYKELILLFLYPREQQFSDVHYFVQAV